LVFLATASTPLVVFLTTNDVFGILTFLGCGVCTPGGAGVLFLRRLRFCAFCFHNFFPGLFGQPLLASIYNLFFSMSPCCPRRWSAVPSVSVSATVVQWPAPLVVVVGMAHQQPKIGFLQCKCDTMVRPKQSRPAFLLLSSFGCAGRLFFFRVMEVMADKIPIFFFTGPSLVFRVLLPSVFGGHFPLGFSGLVGPLRCHFSVLQTVLLGQRAGWRIFTRPPGVCRRFPLRSPKVPVPRVFLILLAGVGDSVGKTTNGIWGSGGLVCPCRGWVNTLADAVPFGFFVFAQPALLFLDLTKAGNWRKGLSALLFIVSPLRFPSAVHLGSTSFFNIVEALPPPQDEAGGKAAARIFYYMVEAFGAGRCRRPPLSWNDFVFLT